MSRLLLPNRFCARGGNLLSPRGARSQNQNPDQNQNQQQQQRRGAGGAGRGDPGARRGGLWLRVGLGVGVGVGVALTVGLKLGATDSRCDERAQLQARFGAAIAASRDLASRIQAEVGAPGLVVGVSVDGEQVWCEGFGYADLENRVRCSADTVMRIASISKPLTAAAAARLCEEGKLDLDAPIQQYLPDFPQTTFNGEDVEITPRLILSHLSGIRHYEKDAQKVRQEKEAAKRVVNPPAASEDGDKPSAEQKAAKTPKKKEFEQEEYYMKESYESVTQALELFKDHPLIFRPGTTFLYSTHAYTLLSAALERAAGQRFLDLMMDMFHQLGMQHTVPDQNEPIVYHRSRFYHLNQRGRVVNSPYVDNSYKWAGGGFLSTAGDLLLFGNALLYSFQMGQLEDTAGMLPGFLSAQSAAELWSGVERTEGCWDKDGRYALGWLVVDPQQKYGQCLKLRHYASHTGGAVGASSVLLVLPGEVTEPRPLPQGVVVSILTNMQAVGLNRTALKIAQEFDKARGLVQEKL